MPTSKNEELWLVSLPSVDRALFLARLAHQLTIVGRESYQPGTDDLAKPQLLRKLNEVQHRVTAWLRSELIAPGKPEFVAALVPMVLQPSDEALSELTGWAWSYARDALEESNVMGFRD